MKCSVERLIEALIGIELAQARKAAEKKAVQARKASYVVTYPQLWLAWPPDWTGAGRSSRGKMLRPRNPRGGGKSR